MYAVVSATNTSTECRKIVRGIGMQLVRMREVNMSQKRDSAFSRNQLIPIKVFITVEQLRKLRRIHWRQEGDTSLAVKQAIEDYLAKPHSYTDPNGRVTTE